MMNHQKYWIYSLSCCLG